MKSVQRGFTLLPRMFAKLGGYIGKNVIGGAAKQFGSGVTDLLGKAIMAVPDGVRDLMDYAGTLNDLRVQTKMTVKDLMILEEAMRLSGAEGDTAKMIHTFSKNLRSAVTEQGEARDAVNKLGFRGSEFRGMKVDEAFRKIGMAAKNFSGEAGELDEIMSSLFGGRMGYKLIRFFDDFDGNMKQASSNVGDFGDHMEQAASKLDDAGDAAGRYRSRWLQLMSVIADALNLGKAGDPVNGFFDWLNPERVRKIVNEVKGAFSKASEWFKAGGLEGVFKDIGKWIGDGIRSSLGDMLSPSGMLKGFFGKDRPATQDRTTSQLIDLNRQQARSLAKIERSGFPAVLA